MVPKTLTFKKEAEELLFISSKAFRDAK